MVGCASDAIGFAGILRSSGLLPPASRPALSTVLPASPLGLLPLPSDAVNNIVVQDIDSLRTKAWYGSVGRASCPRIKVLAEDNASKQNYSWVSVSKLPLIISRCA